MPVERAAGGTSLIDVLDRVLDKGIVIDAWVRVSLVGIDLITVEARVVVASIDTYLKYSEAVGQVAPVSKPAIEGKGYEEVIAENAALRAQLKCRAPARRAAGGRRAARHRAAKRNGAAPYTGVPRVRVAVAERPGDDGSSSRRGCGCSKGFVGRTELADCAQLALQWLGEVLGVSQSICLVRPVGEPSLFVVGAYGLARRRRRRASPSRSTTGATRSSPRSPTASSVSFPRAHSAADRKRRPRDAVRRRARFTSCRSASPASREDAFGLLLRRRQRARCARAALVRQRLQPEARSDPAPAGAGRRRPQAGARALAALQHHQRGHRPDSADRHRRPAAHRERARADAVHRVRGRERRPARRRRA